MRRRSGASAALCSACLLFAIPASAGAATTKTVYAGEPPAATKVLTKYGGAVNAFFLTRVTIHTGDAVKFITNGFHTVDLPDATGKPLPLILTGSAVSGANDAAGNPFWFNGKVPHLSLNAQVIFPQPGTTYDGTKRILNPVPQSRPPKPLTVTFTKAGTYKYFCDIHPGMVGFVVVKPIGQTIPSAKQDTTALAKQVKTVESSAKRVFKTKVPRNTVDLGQTAPGGVEDFTMFPSRLVVPTGTVVTFRMTKYSREVHTATFGPGKYLTTVANSILSLAPQQQAFYPSDNPASGSPKVFPKAHGNGYVNTGFLDADGATKTIPLSGKLKFTKPGVYHYICLIHVFMHGTIIVTK